MVHKSISNRFFLSTNDLLVPNKLIILMIKNSVVSFFMGHLLGTGDIARPSSVMTGELSLFCGVL